MDNGITQQYVLDVQADGVPEVVVDELRELWALMEFGNDNYYYTLNMKYESESDLDNLKNTLEYLKDNGVDIYAAPVLLHFWW